MFRVRIAHLPDGLHQESFQPTAEDLGLDPAVFSDVTVDVRLDLAEGRALAAYAATATARLTCDRTLDLYDQSVAGDHTVLFSDLALLADDDEVLPFDDDAQALDLTAPVHDTLVLALPLRRVSPAAEAADLPTAFGGPAADEPADDRWSALQALRDSSPGDDSDSTTASGPQTSPSDG